MLMPSSILAHKEKERIHNHLNVIKELFCLSVCTAKQTTMHMGYDLQSWKNL